MARGSEDTVILATLKRGKHYSHFFEGAYIEFVRGVPKTVTEALADELEELVDLVSVGEGGDQVEIDRFVIDRDARPLEESEPTTRKVLKLRVEEKVIRPRKAPVVKAPPKGFRRTSAS